MLNRLTVSALLKSVILFTSFCVVIGFSLNAWDAWSRLQVANRIAQIADTSANIFKAMHSLRTDRSTTSRLILGEAPFDADIEKHVRKIRDTEMPAMSNALDMLGSIEFAQKATLMPEFDRSFTTLTALQKEFWEAMAKPKADRRPMLAKDYTDATNAMLATLDKLSGALAAGVNQQDAAIDQLLAIKQIAWLLRNTGGDAAVIVPTALGAGKVSPETLTAYTKLNGGAEAAWTALELTAAGMQLPPAIASAIGRDQERLLRPATPPPARHAAEAGGFRRQAGHDRQSMEPDHGRTPGRRRHGSRSRARGRQGACGHPCARPPSARWRRN